MYFILKDFRSYADAQARAMEAYKDKENGLRWLLRTLLVVVNSLPTEQSRNM